MNENKALDTHLDCIDLYNKAKDALSFSLDSFSYSNELNTSDIFQFILNKKMKTEVNNKSFVSLVYVEDKSKNITSPLFFIPFKYSGDEIVFEDYCIFNSIALESLSSWGININSEIEEKNLYNLLTFLYSTMEMKRSSSKVSLINSLSFYDNETILYANCISSLSSYLKEENEKYYTLFKEVKDEVVEKDLDNINIGLYKRHDRALKRLEEYKATKISYIGSNIFKEILLYSLSYFNKRNESVLIVAPSSEIDELSHFLNNQRLTNFTFDYKNFNVNDINKITSNYSISPLSQEENIRLNLFHENEARFLNFDLKKEEIYSSFKKINNTESLDFVLNHLDNTFYTDLDLNNYNDEDKDFEFISLVESLNTIKDTYIYNHPCFGLKANENEEWFNKIHNNFKDIILSLNQLITSFNENQNFSLYNITIQNLNDFKHIIESMEILSGYNGFPKKFFRINQKEEGYLSLEPLKQEYINLSSSKLLLNNLFTDDIYNLPLMDIVNLYKTNTFFNKHKAINYLKPYLKNKQKDFDVIISIIEEYCKADEKIASILPSYKEKYGNNIDTMNGIVEIESNIKYINKFNMYAINNDDFSIEHPFIKRYLKDKDFRVETQNDIAASKEIYNKIVEEFNNLKQYYDVFYDDFYDMSFASLISGIMKKDSATFEEYNEYIRFNKALNETSNIMNKFIEIHENKKLPLSNLYNEFHLSLIYSYFLIYQNKFSIYSNDYSKVEKDYFSELGKYKETRKIINYQDYYNTIKEKLDDNFINRLNEYKTLSFSYISEYNYQLILYILKSRYGISIISSDEIYKVKAESYNHVIVLDSGLLSNVELLNAYQSGDDVLLINDRSLYDIRTQGYHETFINDITLYKHYFDFSLIPTKFEKKIKEDFNVIDSDKYSYVLKQDNKNYALLPDVLISYEHDVNFLNDLSKYLASFENLILVKFDCLDYIFNSKKDI